MQEHYRQQNLQLCILAPKKGQWSKCCMVWGSLPHSQFWYKVLLYVYKSVEGLSPQYIQDCLIVKRRAEDAMRTHSSCSTNVVVPVSKKCAGDIAFSVVAPPLWNILPTSIKNATSQQPFKSMLKDYLFPWVFSFWFSAFHFCWCNFHVFALCIRWKRHVINVIHYYFYHYYYYYYYYYY